jgi:hypothetical protein
LIDDPAARRALVPGCDAVGWSDFEPTYFDVGDLNGSLGLIFPPDDDADPFAPANTTGRLAEEREESISRTSLRLIEEALEYQEDRHFSKVADTRLKKKQRRVPHDEAWD